MADIPKAWTDRASTPFDFIVVGAGAAGAPLAARLAERGYRVLLTEMGPHKPPKPADAVVENTEVPLLHAEVTEDPRHSLRFFVDHFDKPAANRLDPKFYPPAGIGPSHADEQGIFYPRAQGVGGCTVHNAMITVAGPSEDWDQISEATGDASWRGERMRAYFERIEDCQYDVPTFWGRVRRFFRLSTGWEGGRHGHGGWLQTTVADLGILIGDRRLFKTVVKAALGAIRAGTVSVSDAVRGAVAGRFFADLDPNHWRTMQAGGEGLARIPCAIAADGTRSDPRSRLDAVMHHPDHGKRLMLLTGVCVTAIEFDPDDSTLVVGVQCVPQEHVYQADPNAVGATATPTKLFCRLGGEVILCGGAFNTPQLLMLSGVGPAAELAKHKIVLCVDLPGVGKNLQDRYEVPVVATVRGAFESLDGLGLTSRGEVAKSDPHLQQWKNTARHPAAKRGVYATNGGLIGLFKRSSFEDAVPDLFIFALAGYFPGYHVGYSKPAAFVNAVSIADAAKELPPDEQLAQDKAAAAAPKRLVTWLLLKARTRHHGGEVTLRDANPFRRPAINFRSFPGGDTDTDALALAEGVEFVRGFLELSKRKGAVESFACPELDRPEFGGDLVKWVRGVAWGHHACGTCKIGGDADRLAVLDSRFRVRGVRGLRVADASVFPRIPGVFIVANVYMAAEKAADVLTEDHPLPPATLPDECRGALAADPVLRSRPGYEARRAYPAELEAAEAALVRRRRVTANSPPTPPTQGDAR